MGDVDSYLPRKQKLVHNMIWAYNKGNCLPFDIGAVAPRTKNLKQEEE